MESEKSEGQAGADAKGGEEAAGSPGAERGGIWAPGRALEPWSMPLRGFGREFMVYGGPYFAKPEGYWGVKLAAELDLPCRVNLPIRDYSTPGEGEAERALERALEALFAGERVYAGCFGGKGRTGLFLALLAKAFGEEDPVGYARREYHPSAVETRGQEAFVESFDAAWLSEKARRLAAETADPEGGASGPRKRRGA